MNGKSSQTAMDALPGKCSQIEPPAHVEEAAAARARKERHSDVVVQRDQKTRDCQQRKDLGFVPDETTQEYGNGPGSKEGNEESE